LSGTSGAVAGRCIAVGGDVALAGDGSTWRQQKVPSTGDTGANLIAISC
jgi:hypothetical protein